MRSVTGSPDIIELTIDGRTEAGIDCRVTLVTRVVGLFHAEHVRVDRAAVLEPALQEVGSR